MNRRNHAQQMDTERGTRNLVGQADLRENFKLMEAITGMRERRARNKLNGAIREAICFEWGWSDIPRTVGIMGGKGKGRNVRIATSLVRIGRELMFPIKKSGWTRGRGQ